MPKIVFHPKNTDFDVIRLGLAGRSATSISDETGLTETQVRTRLTKAGIKLKDYRSGNNWVAELVENTVRSDSMNGKIQRDIDSYMRAQIKEKTDKKSSRVAHRIIHLPRHQENRRRAYA